MSWIALDIGGANLKIADAGDFAQTRPFALWRHPDQLTHELRDALAAAPPSTHVAVTMTGELADCFATKRDGVCAILDAVEAAAAGRHQRVYLTDGKLVSPAVARLDPARAAAANWHALASFSRRFVTNASGLLIDVGSTTTDLILVGAEGPLATGTTDTERLCHDELVYTGVERTPICALVDRVPYRRQACRVAAEYFATTGDVYLILGFLPEEPTHKETADGRPATKGNARDRLGRMICADNEEFHHRDAAVIAQAVAEQQCDLVVEALQRVCERRVPRPRQFVVSGKGEFLAKKAVAAFDGGQNQRLQIGLGARSGPCLGAQGDFVVIAPGADEDGSAAR
ncbi:MAG: hydantoinase/oxoprolinase family protein [Planctomycetota bacterium]